MAGLAAGAACSQTPRDPAPTPVGSSSRQTRLPGEYLITLAAGADVNAIADLYRPFGIKGTQDLGHNLFLITLTEDPGPAKMEELGRQNKQINAVQPNFGYRANELGNIK